jgi:hypothetical protein
MNRISKYIGKIIKTKLGFTHPGTLPYKVIRGQKPGTVGPQFSISILLELRFSVFIARQPRSKESIAGGRSFPLTLEDFKSIMSTNS